MRSGPTEARISYHTTCTWRIILHSDGDMHAFRGLCTDLQMGRKADARMAKVLLAAQRGQELRAAWVANGGPALCAWKHVRTAYKQQQEQQRRHRRQLQAWPCASGRRGLCQLQQRVDGFGMRATRALVGCCGSREAVSQAPVVCARAHTHTFVAGGERWHRKERGVLLKWRRSGQGLLSLASGRAVAGRDSARTSERTLWSCMYSTKSACV